MRSTNLYCHNFGTNHGVSKLTGEMLFKNQTINLNRFGESVCKQILWKIISDLIKTAHTRICIELFHLFDIFFFFSWGTLEMYFSTRIYEGPGTSNLERGHYKKSPCSWAQTITYFEPFGLGCCQMALSLLTDPV